MALTDTKLRNLKPSEKRYQEADEGGLFAVRQGARTLDALQQASCFLEVAHDAIDRLAAESESLQAFGAQYLLTFARAAVGAAEASIFRDEHTANRRCSRSCNPCSRKAGVVLMIRPTSRASMLAV